MRPIYEVRFAIEEEMDSQLKLRDKIKKAAKLGRIMTVQFLEEELNSSMEYMKALDTELTEMVRRKHNERETIETFLKNYAA